MWGGKFVKRGSFHCISFSHSLSLSLSLSLLFVIDQRDEVGGSNMQLRCCMNAAAYGSTYFCGSMSLLFWSRQSLRTPVAWLVPIRQPVTFPRCAGPGTHPVLDASRLNRTCAALIAVGLRDYFECKEKTKEARRNAKTWQYDLSHTSETAVKRAYHFSPWKSPQGSSFLPQTVPSHVTLSPWALRNKAGSAWRDVVRQNYNCLGRLSSW